MPFEGHARQSKLMHAQVNTVYEKYMMSEKHYRRIEEYAPKTGTVRLLRLTEKQYDNIYLVTGEPDYQEAVVRVNYNSVVRRLIYGYE